jgi:lipopolysaccharide export LptBFGC system permease protein LptF
MENSGVSISSKDTVKKVLRYFFLDLLFFFTIFAVNQNLLLMNFYNKTTFLNCVVLFLYTLPSFIVLAFPFSVCIGFIYGLVKINFVEKISQNKRNAVPVLILGLIISLSTFTINDFILPNSTKAFSKLLWIILHENETYSYENEIRFESPREMNSLKLLKKINDIHEDGRTLNLYILEYNKKYAIPFSSMFFAFFAISISIVLKNRLKSALFISFVSCKVYWTLLLYGQEFSIRYGKYGALVMWLPNILFLCISIILYLVKYKNKPPTSLQASDAKGFNGT